MYEIVFTLGEKPSREASETESEFRKIVKERSRGASMSAKRAVGFLIRQFFKWGDWPWPAGMISISDREIRVENLRYTDFSEAGMIGSGRKARYASFTVPLDGSEAIEATETIQEIREAKKAPWLEFWARDRQEHTGLPLVNRLP